MVPDYWRSGVCFVVWSFSWNLEITIIYLPVRLHCCAKNFKQSLHHKIESVVLFGSTLLRPRIHGKHWNDSSTHTLFDDACAPAARYSDSAHQLLEQ